MEEFLQRAKSKLNRSKRLEKVHVVIGHKTCDLDSLISAFTYAYFLDKVSPPGVLCLPVLNIPRTEFNYFTETRFILEELNISESFHIFRDEINLHHLNEEGKLSLTLVNNNVLASEDKTLESAVVKVINPVERCDTSFGFQESSSSLVAKEILREAPELVTEPLAHLLRGSILFSWMSMESEKMSEKQEEILSILEEKFPDLPPREDIISVLQETQCNAQGLSIEQTVLKDLKELSDGEIKVAISTVYMTLEDCMFHRNIATDLKIFTEKYGFDVLILLTSYLSDDQQTKRQIAVYSENVELCNQICCELEECQNPCLELEPFECGCDEILVYQQEDPMITSDQMVLLVKEVINRRCSEMVSNSRTSSTEAVAGSAPLSQGSSGIMELYGSDVEPQPSCVNFIENPQDLNGSIPAQVDVNVDLVSPDSGLATIRSSRSSKESSVFLSDDSPVGEGAGSHHSLLPGFDSYSPIPEGAIAEEHKPQSGEDGEHFDLFNFDPAPNVSAQSQSSSRSADYSPADDFFPNSDSSEGQPPTVPKELDEMNLLRNDMANYSAGLLMTVAEKDSLLEFDGEFAQRQESPGDLSERTLSLTDFVGDDSPPSERLKNIGTRVPPTPMNSFVENSPLTEDPTLLFPENMLQKLNDLDHTGPTQTRTRCSSWWGGLEIDSKNSALLNTDTWSSSEQESVFQSPESWKDHKASPIDRRASDSVYQQKQARHGEYPKLDPWESKLEQETVGSSDTHHQNEDNPEHQKLPSEKSDLSHASPQGTCHLIEDFAAVWKPSSASAMERDPWENPANDSGGQVDSEPFPTWTKFSKEDNTNALKKAWNVHQMDQNLSPKRDHDEWAVAKNDFSFSADFPSENLPKTPNNQVTSEAWNESKGDTNNVHIESENPSLDSDIVWNNSKLLRENQDGFNGSEIKGKSFEKVNTWNLYEENDKEGPAPWEDSFLSYRCSDFSTYNVGEDLVASELDTNYSTSDSYISPTFVGEEKETEDKTFDHDVNIAAEETSLNKSNDAENLPQPMEPPAYRNRIGSGPGTLEMWTTHVPNENQTVTVDSETNVPSNPHKDLLKLGYPDIKNLSAEDDAGESSQSSYDDPRMMQMYNETNRQLTLMHSGTDHRQAAPENTDLWNRVILEDTQSTATISDLDNDLDWDDCNGGMEISREGQVQGYMHESTEPETRFSVRQLEPWSVESQEDSQVGWEHHMPYNASEEGKDDTFNEFNSLNEKSGQQIFSNIWDTVMKDDNVSSLIPPDPSHIVDSDENKSPWETLSSSENVKDINIPDKLEILENEQEEAFTPVTPLADSVNQETQESTSVSNEGCFATSPEKKEHPDHLDIWKDQSYKHSEDDNNIQENIDKEYLVEEDTRSSEVDAASGSSEREEGDSELCSPVAFETQGTHDNSIKSISPSVASSSHTNEISEELVELQGNTTNQGSSDAQARASTNNLKINNACEKHLVDQENSVDTANILSIQNQAATDHSLSEMSFEKNETYKIPALESISTEKVDKAPLLKSPQSLDIWNACVGGDSQSNGTSLEINEDCEMKSIKNHLATGNFQMGNGEDDIVSSEYTHSSASSPDLSDPSASIPSLGDVKTADYQQKNQDDWSTGNNKDSELVTTDDQPEMVPEVGDLQGKMMDEFQKVVNHKVPKSLDIWNAQAEDDDSLSSFSSPDGDNTPQNSGSQERSSAVNYYQKNEHEIPETALNNDTKSITISSGINGSSNGEDKLEKEVHLITSQVDLQKDSRIWNIFNEKNVCLTIADHENQEFSKYRDSTKGESQGSPSYEDQSSPDHWNFSPINKNEEQATRFSEEAKCSPETLKTEDASEEASLPMSPKNESEVKPKSTVETLGFSAERAEWWNTLPQKKSPEEMKPSDSDSVLEETSSAYQKVDPWNILIQGDLESKEALHVDPFTDENKPLFQGDNEENYEPSWNIQPTQMASDSVQIEQFDEFDPSQEEKDVKEQLFISTAANELVPESHTQEQCQDRMLPALDQPDSELTHANDSIAISPSSQMTMKSSPGWSSSPPGQVPQDTFFPDILHDNFQEGRQIISVMPDLWTDTEQPLSLKADGENPDILNHCDQESNSQSSTSPDVCHEYEMKEESGQQFAQASASPRGEASEFYLTKSEGNQETSLVPRQTFAIHNAGMHPEKQFSLHPNNEQANVDRLVCPRTSFEPSELLGDNGANLEEFKSETTLGTASGLEPVEMEDLAVENVGAYAIITPQAPAIIKVNSSHTTDDIFSESKKDTNALISTEHPLTGEKPDANIGILTATSPFYDRKEAIIGHSLNGAMNASDGTMKDMEKSPLEENNPENATGRQTICLSAASWGDFEDSSMVTNFDEEAIKEPEHFHYGGEALLEETSTKYPLMPYTPPFDLSFLTEAPQSSMQEKEVLSSEEQSSDSEMEELLFPAPLSRKDTTSHSGKRDGKARHQLLELHIWEDPEPTSLPLESGSNIGSALSSNEVESRNSNPPAGGDMRPPNGVIQNPSDFEVEFVSSKDPELRMGNKEDTCMEMNEDPSALQMDYILVDHEENFSERKVALEPRESKSQLQEVTVGSEQMELPGEFSASSQDILQSVAINEREGQSAVGSLIENGSYIVPLKREDERRALESPGQDPSWKVLGQNEVYNASPEESFRQTERVALGSGHSVTAADQRLREAEQTEVCAETRNSSPHESSRMEKSSCQGGLARKNKNKSTSEADRDALLLKVVAHDNEWEMLSPQIPEGSMAPEKEVEEETEFLDSEPTEPSPRGPLADDVGMDIPFEEEELSPNSADMRPEPPNSLDLDGSHPRRIKLTAPNINLSLDQSEGSVLSDDNLDSPDEIDINVDDLDTPDEADSFEYTVHEDPAALQDSGQEAESIPEYTAEEEREDNRLWRTVVIGEQEQRIDMKVIEPYKRVISHGGYYGDGLNAIIVFAACFLPDSSRADYHYVMENLFLYVISTLELMVAEDYMIVYLNGATPRRKMPGLGWMKKCYQMIDRRLRKNLKSFIIVHPSWFIRTILAVTRPFISSKFSSKIQYVSTLSELSELIPMECVHIPESIIKYDEEKSYKRSVRLDEELREASERANIDMKLKEKL